jgi:hypothetical protein
MYVKLANGAASVFPFNLGDLRQEHPNTSFPSPISNSVLAEYNVYPVTIATPPQYDNKTHRAVQGVANVSGTWVQTWTLKELPFEQASSNVRGHRNYLLAESDWTQLPDSPLNLDAKGAWQLYRETLRMIPQQQGFPWNVTWPPEPTT